MIEEIVRESRRLIAETDSPDEKSVAIAREIEQRWYEYLDELLSKDIKIDTSVTVRVDGQTIKFSSIEDVAQWITTSDK